MGMKLDNIDIKQLLPLFMRSQPDDAAMADVLSGEIRNISTLLPLCSDWESIEQLPEEFLDALAWELNMPWYDYGADITIKRALVAAADYTHRHLGTKGSLQAFLDTFFDNAVIQEWYEYGGDPGHFKIEVESTSSYTVASFNNFIQPVKRQSAVLDSVDLGEYEEGGFSVGAAMSSVYLMDDIHTEV